MTIDWTNQYYSLTPFVTGKRASGGDLALVRAGLRLMLSQRKERIEKLARFVAFHGITLDGSYEESIKLCEFFTENITYEPGKNRMRNEWGEFCIDTGVFIGEFVRLRVPAVNWVIIEEHWGLHPYYHDIGIDDDGELYFPIFSHILLFGHNVLSGLLLHERFRSTFFAEILSEIFRISKAD